MRFCVSTWNYLVNRNESTNLGAVADEIARNGFGLELFLDWLPEPDIFDRTNWPVVKKCCSNRTGLSLHSRVTKTFSEEAIREEINLCRYLEADLLVVHPRSLGIEADTLELQPSVKFGDRDLKRIFGIVEYAGKREVILALENGTIEILEYVRDRLKEKTGLGNFRICVDTGHANLHRERDHTYLQRLFQEFQDELIQVHVSDNFGVKDEHSLPGQGNIDWPAVMSTLKEIDFEGPFVLELRTPPPRESAGKARDFISAFFDTGMR
ncbi:MAG: sugar phosphate isomerase/epimerase [Spirochaetaceae bacterium]|nr:MAG: sugar phosphate isomerase/epimerase [Spirochaetaceae bacterium]